MIALNYILLLSVVKLGNRERHLLLMISIKSAKISKEFVFVHQSIFSCKQACFRNQYKRLTHFVSLYASL